MTPLSQRNVGIRIEYNGKFIRKGNDLYTPFNIDIVTATVGGKITVPTLDYKVNKITEKEMPIPPGTQPGTEFRIKNRGVSYMRGRGRGDQYVIVNIEISTKISDKQKELLLKFRDLNK